MYQIAFHNDIARGLIEKWTEKWVGEIFVLLFQIMTFEIIFYNPNELFTTTHKKTVEEIIN